MIKAFKKPTTTTTTTTSTSNIAALSSDMYKSKLKVKASNSSNNNSNNNNNGSSTKNETTKMCNSAANSSSVSSGSNGSNGSATTTTTTLENTQDMAAQSPPLKKLSLRGNQLCGSILIGNYNYLTQLEVCENEMEILDLSSLAQLETLKCNRNKLMELMINGSSLQTIIADHNCLHKISTNPVPLKLTHIDLSHNCLRELPNWIGACVMLQTLNAAQNQLTNINSFLRAYRINALLHLNLSFNCLQTLERLPEAAASLEKLFLQSNELQRLPENFFAVTHTKLRLLNASCNKLATLSRYEQNNGSELTELYLAGNQLNDSIFDVLIHASKLRVLHLAYNRIGELPAACVRNWPHLEVLVLAGNMLQQLPANVASLSRLQVLRVHSNLLLSTPTLARLSQLKVLDLAHNHLDRVNLLSLVPKNLKYLDLSANLQLQVDEQQLKVCQTQSQRQWSLIDVSGKNRAALPTTQHSAELTSKGGQHSQLKSPWVLGFAETPGNCRKLLVSQLRLGNYRNDEALFGMFESTQSSRAATSMAQLVPHIMQQERTVKDAIGEYMKYTLLTAQQQCSCTGAAICHLAKEHIRNKGYVRPLRSKRYVLRVASMGKIGAYLVRRTSNVCLTDVNITTSQKCAPHCKPLTQSEPHIAEVQLSNEDEYLVLGNAHIWEVMDIERVSRELRKEENMLLAAKRIQDIAQSFGSSDNLSVIVLRFRNIGTDVDHLIKELKQSVRKKSHAVTIPTTNVCKRTCCDRSNDCRHRSYLRPHSERSSPSGQSDQLQRDVSGGGSDEFILAHARVLEEEQEMEMLDETDSVLSEEQFKCWEYMLEQNTQLLFDKELNTISKALTNRRKSVSPITNKPTTSPERFDIKSNLIKSVANKFISQSTPQLMQNDMKKTVTPIGPSYHHQQPQFPKEDGNHQQISFLSKHFGSTRSIQAQTAGYNFFESTKPHDSVAIGPYAKLGGGPNAAYFGSLQRLMPYNLEYDFAVTQERNILDEEEDDVYDDDEYGMHESRIRKYWGVATTEL